MAKSSAVISLTGILDKRFKIVEDDKYAFGFYLVYQGKKYEPDITLHEEISPGITNVEPLILKEDDNFTASGFNNIQGSIIKL